LEEVNADAIQSQGQTVEMQVDVTEETRQHGSEQTRSALITSPSKNKEDRNSMQESEVE